MPSKFIGLIGICDFNRLNVPQSASASTEKKRKNTLNYRSATLNTNFSPDHTSSTAHTFTSTSPLFRPKSLILFSSRSVGTLAAFLGHDIHNIPALSRCLFALTNSRWNERSSLTNTWIKSSTPDRRDRTVTLAGSGLSHSKYFCGGWEIKTLYPSFIPSFFVSGVSE